VGDAEAVEARLTLHSKKSSALVSILRRSVKCKEGSKVVKYLLPDLGRVGNGATMFLFKFAAHRSSRRPSNASRVLPSFSRWALADEVMEAFRGKGDLGLVSRMRALARRVCKSWSRELGQSRPRPLSLLYFASGRPCRPPVLGSQRCRARNATRSVTLIRGQTAGNEKAKKFSGRF